MILVIAEHRDNRLKPITIEALSFAQKAGRDFEQPVGVVLLGTDTASLATDLKDRRIDKVFRLDDTAFAEYEPTAHTGAMAALISTVNPFAVVTGHTTQGIDFLPRLAVRLKRPLVAGVIEYEKSDSRLVVTRQVFNAKMNLKLSFKGSGPYFVTLSPGAFPADDVEAGSIGSVEQVSVTLGAGQSARTVTGRSEAQKGQADLSSAPIIVSGGRGLKEKDNFKIIFELAEAVGGTVGASRPVVDAEWLPRELQVGSSGQTVSPKLYFAIGISGAIQHLVGMQTSRCIVAINKDADAPIFKVAHYGLVEDLFKVVPALTKTLRELKGQ